VVLVGALMMIYVLFGGWCNHLDPDRQGHLLLITSLAMVLVVLRHFGPEPDAVIGGALSVTGSVALPAIGTTVPDGVSAVSLGLAFALGQPASRTC